MQSEACQECPLHGVPFKAVREVEMRAHGMSAHSDLALQGVHVVRNRETRKEDAMYNYRVYRDKGKLFLFTFVLFSCMLLRNHILTY